MDIITNERIVKRNAKIGQYTSLAGLIVLAGGMYISFARVDLFSLSLVALLVGFVLSQVGIYYGNRWSRRPRPDELINQALKGLDGRHQLYHYLAPTAHLLVGPSGIWTIMTRHQRGKISFEKGRVKQRGGNLYMKIFAQESIGRPELEMAGEVESVERFLKKLFPEKTLPEVKPILVFTNERAEVEIEDAPFPILSLKKLKEQIRKSGKSNVVSPELVKEIQAKLEAENT